VVTRNQAARSYEIRLTVGFQRQPTEGQEARVRRHRFRPKSAYKSIAAPTTHAATTAQSCASSCVGSGWRYASSRVRTVACEEGITRANCKINRHALDKSGRVVPVLNSSSTTPWRRIHVLLMSALVGGEWNTSHPGKCNGGEKSPRYPWERALGGRQNRSNNVEKILDPYPDSTF
jgi:hypothetical protein